MATRSMNPLIGTALVLLATLLGLGWLTRRLRGPAGARRSVVLTAQHALHVVELDGERLLIGTGPSGAPRLLARLPELREVAPSPAPQSVAAQMLALAESGPAGLLARVLARTPTSEGGSHG